MKYLKTLFIELIIIISLTLINTILYYFNIISSNIYSTIRIITFIVTLFVSGIYIGKKSNKKYYLEGLKVAVINLFFIILMNLLLKNNFTINKVLHYLLLIIIITFGSIIGGNFKKNKIR